MRIYPQLTTGAIAQFPVTRTDSRRLVQREGMDGVPGPKFRDSLARSVQWHLRYSALCEQECLALKDFYLESEGALKTFTFLDPVCNLLKWSGELERSNWSAGAGLLVEDGREGLNPRMPASRLINNTAASRRIEQSIGAPASFQYCFSLYARSAGGVVIALEAVGGTERATEHLSVTSTWKRVFLSCRLNSDQPIAFGLELPSGGEVEVCGVQVQAQHAPSSYKSTRSQGGVYPRTRFLDDQLVLQAEGLNQYSATVRLISAA
jgi:hypothetical protein